MFRFDRSGNTIVEAIVVIVIISFWLVETYELLFSGLKLANTTEARIQAINLAREGLEATENVRNTNWVKFSSDLENCFDTRNFDSSCVGDIVATHESLGSATVKPLLVQSGSAWYFTGTTASWSWVVYDDKGLSLQWTGSSLAICNSLKAVNCRSRFFRTVRITDEGVAWNRKIRVKSTVEWQDSSRLEPYQITLERVLTNWKKNF